MIDIPSEIPTHGRIPPPLLLEVTRDLLPQDLRRLSDAPKTSVPTLQRLRAIHHRQAQLLASGRTATEVAAIVGVTVQRLVQLQVDPAFTQLVAYYQDQIMVQALEDGARLKDKLTDLGEMAVDELRERLEDDQRRKSTHIGEIRKIAEFAMDRTVAPPKTAVPTSTAPTAITINFGTKLKPRPASPLIDGVAEPEGRGQGIETHQGNPSVAEPKARALRPPEETEPPAPIDLDQEPSAFDQEDLL